MKNTKNLKRNMAITAMIILLSIVFTSSTLTLSSVNIVPENDQQPKTSDTLNCTWSWSGGGASVKANVTWYNGTDEILSQYNLTDNYARLNKTYTAKGEVWNCTVILGNQSSSSGYMSDVITIKNSPPAEPFVQHMGTNIENYYEITEDLEYTFILNTSDADGDNLEYFETSTKDFCEFPSSSSRTITCNATAQPNTSITDRFWFYANDGTIAIGTYVDFNVTPVNDRPYFAASLSNHTMYENQTMSYSFTVNDEENNTGPYVLDYNFNISSQYGDDRLNISAAANVFSIFFENDRKATIADIGNKTVWVWVCDPDDNNLCINDSFKLEVITINHVPNLTLIRNYSATQGDDLAFYVNGTDEDVGNVMSFSIEGINCGYDPWSIATTNSSYNNATGLVNVTLNNSHMKCPNVTITLGDNYGGSDSQIVYFNFTNTDDDPIIYEMSHYDINTNNNNNLSDITAYMNTRFLYRINGTDPDIGIDPNEALTYTDNSSACGINCPELDISAEGLINQTFTSSGNYSYEINLTDYYNNYSTAILNIEVLDNQLPQFNHSIGNFTLNETINFLYQINASDPEGTAINFTDNSSIINITNEGLINHTYQCQDIGNYSVKVTIRDQTGASNYTDFNIEILNYPQAPILPNFGNLTIIEGYLYTRNVRLETVDFDLNEYCSKTQDSLNFTSRFISGPTLFNITSAGVIQFMPNKTYAGSYKINITAFDSYGLNSSKTWNLTIQNRSSAPSINNITPHSIPMNLTWAPVTDFPDNITSTNTSENTTVDFDHNSTDPSDDPLAFNWTVDGTVVSYEKDYSRYFDFDDAGNYLIRLQVSDNATGLLENFVYFTWNLTVHNKNRAPMLNSTLPDITINTTTVYETYLTGGAGNIRFNDPDGDNLTYTNSNISKVTISYSGDTMTITPVETGVEEFTITASDAYASVASSNITINVTGIPQAAQSNDEDDDSGSSSGSSTRSEIVPYTVLEEVEIEKEVYLDILNPEPAVIYNNNTLRQVISLINTGNQTLRGISLSATTNTSDAEISFSNSYFPDLGVGETERTDLIIVDYELYENYEVVIYANVSEPFYKDKAVIYINALTKSRGNQSVTSTKITFAQDLLASNPECIELNEFLKRALNMMNTGNYDEAAELTDSVIQGCKYLVSQAKLKDERPSSWVVDLGLDKIPFLKPALIIFAIISVAAVVLTIRLKKANDEKEKA